VHRCAESAPSIRGKGHEPPLTVLAEDELPVLAEPVESDDDPVLDEDDDEDEADDDAGVVAVPDEDIVVEDDALPAVLAVPAWVCADRTASDATAAVATTPKAVVSLPRRRSARSRSAAVMRRFGVRITGSSGPEAYAGASKSSIGALGVVPGSFMTSSVPPAP
jgi:hypothetical protein